MNRDRSRAVQAAWMEFEFLSSKLSPFEALVGALARYEEFRDYERAEKKAREHFDRAREMGRETKAKIRAGVL